MVKVGVDVSLLNHLHSGGVLVVVGTLEVLAIGGITQPWLAVLEVVRPASEVFRPSVLREVRFTVYRIPVERQRAIKMGIIGRFHLGLMVAVHIDCPLGIQGSQMSRWSG